MGKSSSLEDYLKSILILHNRNGSVRSIDIAEEMGVFFLPMKAERLPKAHTASIHCSPDS